MENTAVSQLMDEQNQKKPVSATLISMSHGCGDSGRLWKRDILDGLSDFRMDRIKIKMTDTTSRKKGGQGVVAIGTIGLPAAVKEVVSEWKAAAETFGLSPEQLNTVVPMLKEELKRWAPVVDAVVEMTGKSPEALEAWTPEMKVAVKMLEWNRTDDAESIKFFKSFVHELSLMAELSHPNIIQLVGFVEDMEKGDVWMILPWEANGNVREFLQSGKWDLPERLSLIKDTATGVEYLHTHQPPISHGDLKSLNILVNSSYRAVITDFGSARIKKHLPPGDTQKLSDLSQGIPGRDGIAAAGTSPEVKFNPSTLDLTLTGPKFTLRWTAPEVICGEDQDLPSDIWAIGWICWEIVTGRIPFEELNTEGAIINYAINGQLPDIRSGDTDLSHILMLCALMSECWLLDPTKRIDASAFRKKFLFMPCTTPSGNASDGPKTRSARLQLDLGRISSLQNDHETAVRYFQSAIDAATRTKDEGIVGHALICLGESYRAHSKPFEAEQAFRRAHEISSRIGNDVDAANSLNGLGRVYGAQSKDREAEEALMQAHKLYLRSGHDLGAAAALEALGEIYRAHSKYHKAEKVLIEAYEIHSRLDNDLGTANVLLALGLGYLDRGRYREAESMFVESREVYSHIGNEVGTANALDGLGHIYGAQTKYREAEEAFTEAHKVHSRIGNDIGASNALEGLGTIYLEQLKYSEAEKAFIEAHEIHSRIGHDLGTANVLDGLGRIYGAQSKYKEAEKAFMGAQKMHSCIGNDKGVANALLGLGNIYRVQSRHRDAEKAFNDGHKIHPLIGNDLHTAETFRNLASLYQVQYRYDEAEASYIQAIAAFDRVEDHESRAKMLLALGRLRNARGRYADAEEPVTEAVSIWVSLANEELGSQADAYLLLAQIFKSQGKQADAASALIQAEAALAQLDRGVLHAATLHLIGDNHSAEGMHDEAEERYRLAQAIFLSIGDLHGEAAQLICLGNSYVQQGRHVEAEECFTQARVGYAMVADEGGEAEALDMLMEVYALQGKFSDAEMTCVEACKLYMQMGQPMSHTCVNILGLLRSLEKSML